VATRSKIAIDELTNRFKSAARVAQLLEVRDRVRVAMRQVSDDMDDADDGGGDDAAELSALFEQLKGLLSAIDDRLNRRAIIDDLERRATGGVPLRDGTDRDFQRQCCEFSLFRAAGHAIGLHVDAGREIEVQQELVRRAKANGRTGFTGNVILPYEALSVQIRHLSRQQLARYETRDIVGPVETRVIGSAQPPGTTGGSLIGTYTDPAMYVDILRPSMAVRQAGARVLSDMRENLRLPRMTQSATPGWFAENSPIPVSDEQFDDIVMTPHHDGAIVEVTRNMLQQANPEIEAIVRNDLALRLANDVDRTALAGTGVAPQPLGIVSDPATPFLPAGALSYDAVVSLINLLATANAISSGASLAFIGDANVMTTSMLVKDLYARPLGDELLYHGYPTYWTNLANFPAAPTDPLVFGNWADLVIAFWSELDVLVNPYESTAFSKGNVQIRAAMTLDIAKRHPESFGWFSMNSLTPAEPTVQGLTWSAQNQPPAPATEGRGRRAAA
jgi:HK97 family phage major capsid protein